VKAEYTIAFGATIYITLRVRKWRIAPDACSISMEYKPPNANIRNSNGTESSQGGTHGSGAITVVKPARSAVAPTVPSLVYIAPANKGNPAANDERSALFAAMADAAMGRYATTR
jgi:hypothetical protein